MARRPARRRPIVRTVLAVGAAAALLYLARRELGERMTAPGEPADQRPLAGAGVPALPVERRPVRVVVLDGLTRADADGAALDALCARGMDLVIDVGFPTKSLAVQSVLWTGLTAQQTGVSISNDARFPHARRLPAEVPGAIAVAESWPQIAGAMGFPHVIGGRDGFAANAAAAVAGDAPLVLVHVLEIDEVGHAHGRGAAYRAAVARADALLADLVPRKPEAAWIVLSDHGHLAGGGHGDAEPEVRRVRGCVTPRPPGAPPRGEVHLVDVSRHLHDTLGAPPHQDAVGRPLSSASRTLDRDATLPRTPPLAWLAALAVFLGGAWLTWRLARPRWAAFGIPVTFAAYTALCGYPTLSGRSPDVALALGCALALALLTRRGRFHPGRVMALAIPAVSVTAAAAIAGGALSHAPPVLPYVTATWQVLASLSTGPLLAGVGLAAWLSGARTETRPDPGQTASGGSDQHVRGPDSAVPG